MKSAIDGTGLFLSTPSARRATAHSVRLLSDCSISIHALREEGDAFQPVPRHALVDFYPRPPRGGRPLLKSGFLKISIFLSTPSARRATCASSGFTCDAPFLSTPSARRATPAALPLRGAAIYFYPRPPRGGRLLRQRYMLCEE